MKRIACVLFWLLAAPSLSEPPAPGANDPFDAVDRLAERLKESAQIAREARPAGMPRGRAEGALHVLRQLLRAMDEELAWANTDQPYFDDADTRFAKLALGNPDNLYLVARVDDDASYRIHGKLGSTADFAVQLYQGYPGIERPFEAHGSLDLDSLEVAPDGSFEIHVSRERRHGNWIELRPHTRRILLRYTYADWERERAGEIDIEREGTRGNRSPAPGADAVSKRLDATGSYLLDAMRGYRDTVEAIYAPLAPNSLSPLARTGAGGLSGQYIANGRYALRDDQALIVRTRPSGARYQGFQLGSWWFVALDYANRQTSLNTRQAHLASDGRYHFVVSTRDPGVPNWLDASGDPEGLMLLRWQGAGELGAEHQPQLEVVTFDTIRDHLPADEPSIDPAARSTQIASRQAAIAHRYGLGAR